jgi:glutamyl-tRNA reductase
VAALAHRRLQSKLREQGELAAADVVRRNQSLLASLGERDRQRAEAIAYAVAARLLAEPELRLEFLERDDEQDQVEAIRELFGLARGSRATSK